MGILAMSVQPTFNQRPIVEKRQSTNIELSELAHSWKLTAKLEVPKCDGGSTRNVSDFRMLCPQPIADYCYCALDVIPMGSRILSREVRTIPRKAIRFLLKYLHRFSLLASTAVPFSAQEYSQLKWHVESG